MNAILQELPELDSFYHLEKTQINSFQDKGYIKLNNICTNDEISSYKDILKNTVLDAKKDELPLEDRDLYGKAFLQVGNLWKRNEQAKKFVLAKRFGKIAADLMGVDGVRLYHDQGLYKEASGGITPWHQDQYYWPVLEPHTITMWMPMVDLDANMGIVEFAEESHKKGPIASLNISQESLDFYDNYVKENNTSIKNFDSINAGDATFHSGWTLHRAGENITGKMREIMTIIFIADGITIKEPEQDSQKSDMNKFFPGKKPGDIGITEMNPLIYKR